jgi:hypothetical protein
MSVVIGKNTKSAVAHERLSHMDHGFFHLAAANHKTLEPASSVTFSVAVTAGVRPAEDLAGR